MRAPSGGFAGKISIGAGGGAVLKFSTSSNKTFLEAKSSREEINAWKELFLNHNHKLRNRRRLPSFNLLKGYSGTDCPAYVTKNKILTKRKQQ